LKLLAFDREFAASLGLPVRGLEVLLTLLLVLVVVIGLQTVGVILMVAALVTPAAAARQWTQSLGLMILLAATFGAGSGAAGALLSASAVNLPTGPVIVLCASAILLVSLVAAPARGLIWSFARARLLARRVRLENLLKDVYLAGERAGDCSAPVRFAALRELRPWRRRELAAGAGRLRRGGLAVRAADRLRLTDAGLEAAERLVRKHRLWEVYLIERLRLPSDHVHRDAEAMEHALTDEAVAELERTLGYPAVDPHGKRIPPARLRAREAPP
jgi:manganese/zinc/iron transport system permease protein